MIDNPSSISGTVLAAPVKSFFVSMLTRDIGLEEAILDLLDNCVDGILRSTESSGAKPYSGFKAEIEFGQDSFSISDNCGGIPWDLHEFAFRMGRSPGRSPDAPGSVGVYGIGMKRAIFKMGKYCLISTRSKSDQYEVEIKPDWIEDESDWDIPVHETDTPWDYDGTRIVIRELYEGIGKLFSENTRSFRSELLGKVSSHYAYIIEKGFQIIINGTVVEPRTTKLVFDTRDLHANNAIMPYLYKGTSADGVSIFLAVGFTRSIPSGLELIEEQEGSRYSSIDAGWTILCNDRAVVYCDRSELTGWGEAGVPRYHTQFIAISGVVEFRCDDPSKLPTTTTKRGIDSSSPLYLQVKNRMREGMKIFTQYTNKWKGNTEESRRHIQRGRPLALDDIKTHSQSVNFRKTRTLDDGQQFKPRLPAPVVDEPTKGRISFYKELVKIKDVAEFLGNPEMDYSDVGRSLF